MTAGNRSPGKKTGKKVKSFNKVQWALVGEDNELEPYWLCDTRKGAQVRARHLNRSCIPGRTVRRVRVTIQLEGYHTHWTAHPKVPGRPAGAAT